MSQAVTSAGAAPRDAGTATRPRVSAARLLRPLLMVGGVAVVAIGAVYFWLGGGRYVSIDNAYVRAAKVAVSTDVSGIVAEVDVHEGELVHKGQPLIRLQQGQFQFALDGAKASQAQIALNLQAMQRDYQRMLRDADARSAQVQSDQSTADRLAALLHGGGVTRQEAEDAHFKLVADQQTLESLRIQAQVALARLGGTPDADVTTLPQYREATARVEEAQRQLDHSVVYAPFDGIATQVESVQPGMYLAASTAAFGLVSTEHVWIDANPKETELTFVKPGDHVDVTIDTYPGHVWTGTVDSIAPASGSEFSILPAQNSSGNWVKVVQRIPLRVRIDRQPGDPDLRAGMSVEAAVDTGHTRHLSDLF
jgi:membrane fusion protein (multidrug efflux system)